MLSALSDPATIGEKADRGWLWRILVLSLLLRILLAALTPLGVDEAYAIAVAREFSWSFFDHPPLGFWSPVVTANLTGLEHPLIYRAPTLIYGTLTTWLLYAIGRDLAGSRAGLWAALVHALTPGFLLAGVIVLPDGPLGVGSAIAVLWLLRNAKSDGPAPMRHWVWLGLGLALALASKYQAALIPIATLVFMLVLPVGRRWFLQPGPYIAALIGLIGLAPVLVWNAGNGWASLAFQSGRTGDGVNVDNLALMLAGQGVYLLPPVIVLAVVALWRALRSGLPERQLLALIALGPIIAFNIVYLFSNASFPHWTMPGWIFALPLIGAWLAGSAEPTLRRARNWLLGFAVPAIALLLVLSLHLSTGLLTRFSEPLPKWDRTTDLFDYSPLYPALQTRGDLADIDVIAARTWITAGFMSTALQGRWPMRVMTGAKHHFPFMSGQNMVGTALLLEPGLIGEAEAKQAAMLQRAQKIDPAAFALEPVILNRGGRPYVAVTVIRFNIAD